MKCGTLQYLASVGFGFIDFCTKLQCDNDYEWRQCNETELIFCSTHFSQNFELLHFLKADDAIQATQLLDIVVSYPLNFNNNVVQVDYVLVSVNYNVRYIVRTVIPFSKLDLRTVSDLYPSAVWLERQAWDMFGVFFTGNPDLRRILTDYGFDGHPMRKDFPLSGYFEVRYDDTQKRIVSEPISLTQEFRNFSFRSPWQ